VRVIGRDDDQGLSRIGQREGGLHRVVHWGRLVQGYVGLNT
jgi:hypothetical protein